MTVGWWGFLTRAEIEALLAAPDIQTWIGRRDYAILLMALQTGLRLSEMTSLGRQDLELGTGAHVRCQGKGRKERCTPLTAQAVKVLEGVAQRARARQRRRSVSHRSWWADECGCRAIPAVAKHTAVARNACPSLKDKRVTPHVCRHTAAMEMLQAGVDSLGIALCLGHESVKTTQIYLDANLAIKEAALAKMTPIDGSVGRFRPSDRLLQFLKDL
ncbi:MAG: tyrosine-type recombinase/integrase [Comamonadaceae bacterium]|nr:tyrosine-type recombinase/integrase [Comamonadaceae bacterium]